MSKIRVLKVMVQPLLLEQTDDGELREIEGTGAVTIPGIEWPTYSSVRFKKEIAEWQKRMDEKGCIAEEAMEGAATEPINRASRRKAARARPKRAKAK